MTADVFHVAGGLHERYGGSMTEKRLYERVAVGVNSVLYFMIDGEPHEVQGILRDVSAKGIAVEVDDTSIEQIKDRVDCGSVVHFQTCDEYELFGQMVQDVLDSEAEVVRVQHRDGQMVLGCKMNKYNQMLAEYVEKKLMCNFIQIALG